MDVRECPCVSTSNFGNYEQLRPLTALQLTPLVYYGRSGSPRRALLFRFATRPSCETSAYSTRRSCANTHKLLLGSHFISTHSIGEVWRSRRLLQTSPTVGVWRRRSRPKPHH